LSGSPLGDEMRRHLSAAVSRSGRLSLIPERLAADAVLVGEVEESAGRLTVDVRLVNVRGRVLWRERALVRKGEVGAALAGAAERMVESLLKRQKAETRRE
jgi:TolB-like protein